MGLIGGKLPQELIFVHGAAQGVAQGAEAVYGFSSQAAHIVFVVADHNGHLRNGAVKERLFEALSDYFTVRVGHEPALHGANLIGGGFTHGGEGGEPGAVHGGLAHGVKLCLGAFRGESAGRESAAALDDGSGHDVLGEGRDQQRLHAHGAGALSKHGNLGRVSAKDCDVVLHPLQGGRLVHGAVVAALALLSRELGVAQESEDAQAVVDGNQDNVSLGPFVSVHGYFIAVSIHIGAAVDPQGHRQLGVLAQRLCRGPDV